MVTMYLWAQENQYIVKENQTNITKKNNCCTQYNQDLPEQNNIKTEKEQEDPHRAVKN